MAARGCWDDARNAIEKRQMTKLGAQQSVRFGRGAERTVVLPGAENGLEGLRDDLCSLGKEKCVRRSYEVHEVHLQLLLTKTLRDQTNRARKTKKASASAQHQAQSQLDSQPQHQQAPLRH